MSTANLFTAAELVYSEFDTLRSSRREHNIPESMVGALEALASALYSPEVGNKKVAQPNPIVDSSSVGTISNANQALLALRLLTIHDDYVFSADENAGLHLLFCCVSDAMLIAEHQAGEERRAV